MNLEDNLSYRFTSYITKVIQFARKDYLKKLTWKKHEIPLEMTFLSELGFTDPPLSENKESFSFENQLLETAFQKLSELRRQILELIFVNGMKPSEIAAMLNCPVDFVYREKNRALDKLRQLLERMDSNGTE